MFAIRLVQGLSWNFETQERKKERNVPSFIRDLFQQTSKQTNKQNNKQTNKQTNSCVQGELQENCSIRSGAFGLPYRLILTSDFSN